MYEYLFENAELHDIERVVTDWEVSVLMPKEGGGDRYVSLPPVATAVGTSALSFVRYSYNFDRLAVWVLSSTLNPSVFATGVMGLWEACSASVSP